MVTRQEDRVLCSLIAGNPLTLLKFQDESCMFSKLHLVFLCAWASARVELSSGGSQEIILA